MRIIGALSAQLPGRGRKGVRRAVLAAPCGRHVATHSKPLLSSGILVGLEYWT